MTICKKCKEYERLVEAVKSYKEAKQWAERNPQLMLNSSITSEEAAVVMREYFDKEAKMFQVLYQIERDSS